MPELPEPFVIFASLATKAAVGGIPTTTVNFLVSESTSTLTGTFIPGKSLVFSLIIFTTCNTFTPMGPNAGPSGGPALASPPLTRAEIDFLSPIYFKLDNPKYNFIHIQVGFAIEYSNFCFL